MSLSLPLKPSVPITMARSYFPPEDIATFQREAVGILEGRVSMGPWVERFQDAAATYHGTRYAFATNACTSALEVALMAHGVGPGDEVIVPVETFIATGMAVHNIGARPVFADIRAETLCLDPAELERAATTRVKAVILVHFGGLITPDLPIIQEICARKGWALIEDGAHAHGARFDGRPAGSLGAAGCFSYYPTKLITAGEGGMVVTGDERIARICRSYQLRGQDTDLPGEQFARRYGRNIRLPELSALLGVLQYGRLQAFVESRRRIAAIYDALLAQEPSLGLIPVPERCFHSYWLYTLLLPPGVDRMTLQARCKADWDIDMAWSYSPPLHLMPVFRELYGTQPGQLPVAEEALARTLCLPIHPLISETDGMRVAECFLHTYRTLAP